MQEITKDEALGRALLGECHLGLLVELSTGDYIFENLIIKGSQCYYWNQGDTEMGTWGSNRVGLRNFQNILENIKGSACVCDEWEEIHKIFLLGEI